MSPEEVIPAEEIPPPFNGASETRGDLDSAFVVSNLKEARSQFERAYIEAKLREFNGNISQTAEAIGVERSNLHKKIKTYGLDTPKAQ
jgi:two-component system nitrogen regulation response regulator NtrX